MSIISKIKNALLGESTLSAPEQWLLELGGDPKNINPDTAMEVTACYACVRLLSNQVASLPLNVYKDATDGRERVKDSLYYLLNVEPNPYITAFQFWNALMVNLCLTGVGYAEVERERKSKSVKALWPIPTSYVRKTKSAKGEPQYEVRIKGQEMRIIPYGNMLEIPGLTYDGYSVYEPIQLLKRTLGLARSAEDYSREYFDEGTHPSGIISYDGALKPDKRAEFKDEIKKGYSGLGKHHRVMLMEDGMKFQKISAPPNEGQMFESRKFQVIEICRFFNVPPHKVMELDRATWNNIEEMNISFVNDSLMPYLLNIKQAAMQTLLFGFQKEDGLYLEHDLNALLRGRLQDRFAAYAQARQWGWLSVNEIRNKENMPGIGSAGEIYLEPSNMKPAGEGGSQ